MRRNNLLLTHPVLAEMTAHWPLLDTVAAGCGCVMGIDQAGQAHYAALNRLHVFSNLWQGMRQVAVDPELPGLALGLRMDGTLVLTHEAHTRAAGDWFSFFPVRNAVHHWAGDAVQVLLNGRYALTLTKTGGVRAVRLMPPRGWLSDEPPLTRDLAAWTGAARLLCASPDTVYAADGEGRLMIAGARTDYEGLGGAAFREAAESLSITAVCCYAGGESVCTALLTRDGRLIGNALLSPITEDCVDVSGAGHAAAALTAAGRVVSFGQEALPGVRQWPEIACLSLGTDPDGAAFAAGLIR